VTITLSARQTLLLRMRAQRLHPSGRVSTASPARILRDMVALQAQELPAALLSVRVRSAGLTAAQVEQARQCDRSIVWTWSLRGTMHLIDARDAGWLIPFLGPQFIKVSLKRFKELGWDEWTADTGLQLLQSEMAERGALTRLEIIRLLEENGLPSQGQAPFHLIRRAALEGILCLGADRQKETTYVLYKSWLGELQPLSPQDALVELAARYLNAYAPATPEDLASWSGLKINLVREAWHLLADRLVEVYAAGVPSWMLEDQLAWLDELPESESSGKIDSAPVVRLLPGFDTYLLGYASRHLVVDAEHARRIHPGGGIIYPVLLVDGRALGTWKSRPRRGHREIVLKPFPNLAEELLPYIEAEVADMARFLEDEISFIIEDLQHT